jgi:hypothetical protein
VARRWHLGRLSHPQWLCTIIGCINNPNATSDEVEEIPIPFRQSKLRIRHEPCQPHPGMSIILHSLGNRHLARLDTNYDRPPVASLDLLRDWEFHIFP